MSPEGLLRPAWNSPRSLLGQRQRRSSDGRSLFFLSDFLSKTQISLPNWREIGFYSSPCACCARRPSADGKRLISGPFLLPATSASGRDFPSGSTMNQTLEISCTFGYRGFESHPLRQKTQSASGFCRLQAFSFFCTFGIFP